MPAREERKDAVAFWRCLVPGAKVRRPDIYARRAFMLTFTLDPGSYNPETHLYIYGTGNPTPAYTQGRGDGDNLFTSCLGKTSRRGMRQPEGLWYSEIGGLAAPAETFVVDGKQHMLFSGGGGLFMFVLN